MGRKKQQFIALLSAAGLLLTMAACGTSGKEPVQTGGETEGKETQAAQTAETDMEKDASGGQEVTLDILAKNVGESFNQYADNHVQDKMAEDIGVRIHMVNADNDKWKNMVRIFWLMHRIRLPSAASIGATGKISCIFFLYR